MPSKRKYNEVDPQAGVHASRRIQVYGDKLKPSKKPRQTETPLKEHTATVNSIKKQIRDIRRRLARLDNLPANIRADDERALAAYEQELAEAEAAKVYQRNLQRFHMVRFFERQKSTRTLKRLRKELLEAKSEDQVESIKRQLHVAEVDLNYTQFCPLGEVYISLYPRKSQAEDEEEEVEEEEAADDEGKVEIDTPSKPPMWAEVEKRMEESTLDELRNRIAPVVVSTAPRKTEKRSAPKKRKPQPAFIPAPEPELPEVDTSGMNRRERRKLLRIKEPKIKTKSKSAGFEKNQAFGAAQAISNYYKDDVEDDGSDGGFFED